jgi:hypothetical protein
MAKSKHLEHYHQPTARQCALLVLRLIQAREQELEARARETRTGVSRARISQNTLRTLCRRAYLPGSFVAELQEFLLAAGWCLFCVGPTYYALIRKSAVEGWARISSARISEELSAVSRGTYKFEPLEFLLLPADAKIEHADE